MSADPAFGHEALGEAYRAVREALFERAGTEEAFNPYADRHPELDREDAVGIRRENLRRYFAAYAAPPALFLLAEAPGPWGCRFSGVPITAEAQLLDPDFPLGGRQSSRGSDPHTEYSAGIFWRLLQPAFPHFFVWNSVPLHPHHAGRPLTIRTPRASELDEHGALAARLIDLLRPRRVLAVGRKAERVLARRGIDATYVRHPSQGGATLFAEGVREALAEAGIMLP